MKKILSICLFQIVTISTALCQYDNIWMLGIFQSIPSIPKCGIDFSNGVPDTFSLIRPMPMFNTSASLCDSLGNLLFYSNGIYIANSNHDSLLNSSDFNPGTLTNSTSDHGLPITQAVLFLQYPDKPNFYFVFNESEEPVFIDSVWKGNPTSLRYSVINMTLDSGNGGIDTASKAVIIINDTLVNGCVTACKHGNGRDWWVLAQKFNDSLFYKVLITPDSIIVTNQTVGSKIFYDIKGQACFSPDGNKYILLTQNHSLDVFDFDRCNGSLFNHKKVTLPDTIYGYTGASISPNSRFLYVNTQINIYQFDLNAPNIDSSIITVAIIDSTVVPFYYFHINQLGPDGRIYISNWNSAANLHYISEPDSIGLLCDVQQHALLISEANFAVSNSPNYNLGRLQGSLCDTLQWAGIQEQEGISDFKIYPNPVINNILNIGYQLPHNKSGIFKIYDVMGKVVFKYNLPQWSHLQVFNLPKLSSGVYNCIIKSNNFIATKKLIVIEE